MEILGVDIGGTVIKGAPVNVKNGRLTAERHRIPTPQPATPAEVVKVVVELTHHFKWRGPIGCTFPAVIKHGVAYSAANVDKAWIGTNGEALLSKETGLPALLINDADAAGIAEMEFGAGHGHRGLVIMLTFGTGIGSAVFFNGQLLPNTEFGHMEIRGKDAEDRASGRIRKAEDLSWKKWAVRVNEFLKRMEIVFSPDLFILGGGVSRKHANYLYLLDPQADIKPAEMLNDAGIIGAAMAARSLL